MTGTRLNKSRKQHIVVKNWEEYLSCGGNPSLHFQVQGERAPQFLAVETSGDCGWVRSMAAKVPGVPLKRPTHKLIG